MIVNGGGGDESYCCGGTGSDVEDTIYVSSGCKSEQINITPITNVFANSFIELPKK